MTRVEVEGAVAALEAKGCYASIEKVRQHLGHGSRRDVEIHLRSIQRAITSPQAVFKSAQSQGTPEHESKEVAMGELAPTPAPAAEAVPAPAPDLAP